MLTDDAAGWRRYLALLAELAGTPGRLAAEDEEFMRDWAIGSSHWKSDMLKAHFVMVADDSGISGTERRATNEARWHPNSPRLWPKREKRQGTSRRI